MRWNTPVTRFASALVVAFTLAATQLHAANVADPLTGKVAEGSPESKLSASHGFDLANIDPTCKACDDFYRYANGDWLDAHPVPEDKASYGHFNELADANQAVLHTILDHDEADAAAASGSPEQQSGAMYASCMDTATIDKVGLTPLLPEFAKIDAIGDRASLVREVARLHDLGATAFFRMGPDNDPKNSNLIILQASQGGLGLPNRDYYIEKSDRFDTIRAAYRKHVATMLHLMGEPQTQAESDAGNAYDVEYALALGSKAPKDLRDPEKLYHPTTVAALGANVGAPDIDWARYVADRAYPSGVAVNVATPDFFPVLDKTLTTTPLPNVKAYLRWHLLDAYAVQAGTTFENENFAFTGTVLNGVPQQLPRWKRCVAATDRAVGEALGQEYVKRTFTPATKKRALELVANLSTALKMSIMNLDWMSPATKTEAVAKLEAYTKKIGYPDHWLAYDFTVKNGEFLGNTIRARAFTRTLAASRLGKSPDRALWGMTPPTVNAYYNPPNNEIVFPAGILQPPFFNPLADDAVNYGGIGAVIGHEMTHGFDDQGRKTDKNGNLRDWWTAGDATAFKAKAQCVSDQFDSYEVAPGVHEQGPLVLGESIADLGGITVAYRAFKMTPEGKTTKTIDGFTPDQRFFLGWAQVWGATTRQQAEISQAKTDPHPADRFRADGPLSNMPAFAAAFSCAANTPMVRPPAKRCAIW
jgi:putative endopeptidase